MFIALNRYGRAQRRRLTMAVVLMALCAAVGVAHGAMGADHMAMGDIGGHTPDVTVAMCLAIVETAAIVAVGVAIVAIAGRRLRPFLLSPARVTSRPRCEPTDLRARSSPVRLQVMRR